MIESDVFQRVLTSPDENEKMDSGMVIGYGEAGFMLMSFSVVHGEIVWETVTSNHNWQDFVNTVAVEYGGMFSDIPMSALDIHHLREMSDRGSHEARKEMANRMRELLRQVNTLAGILRSCRVEVKFGPDAETLYAVMKEAL